MQQTAAHVGRASVEQRQQRGRCFAAQGLGDLQVAPCRGIHAHIALGAVDLQAADVADGLALGQFGIAEQCTGGFQSDGEIIAAESGQVEGGKLLAKRAPGSFQFEMPGRERFARHLAGRHSGIFREQDFRGLQPFQFGGQVLCG